MADADLTAALKPMADMLAADGYLLEATRVAESVRIAVKAGPDACAECLVPKPIMQSIAAQHLADNGVHADIELLYPVDA